MASYVINKQSNKGNEMKTKEVKLYVQAVKYNWQKEFVIDVRDYKTESSPEQVVVHLSEVKVEVQIPDIDEKRLTLEEVKQLEQAITEEDNASYARIKAIKEKIQSLLCIEQGE